MVSPEMIRAYPFFSGFSMDEVAELSMAARELKVDSGHVFFTENQEIHHFYLIRNGKVAITLAIPSRKTNHSFQQQILRELATEDLSISTLQNGEMFGWSAIIPPHVTTAAVKAIVPTSVIEFDYQLLTPVFEENCTMGHLLVLKAAQVVRDRLRNLRIELIAPLSENTNAFAQVT